MPTDHAASFQKSLKSIGTPSFHDSFLTELQAYESNVNLERYCDEGFPDPESIEFELDSVESADGSCTVRVSCKFSEAVQTGCSDVSFAYPAVAKFDVILDRQSETVTFDYLTDADEYRD